MATTTWSSYGNVVFQDVDFSTMVRNKSFMTLTYADKGERLPLSVRQVLVRWRFTNLINRFTISNLVWLLMMVLMSLWLRKILFVSSLASCFKIPIFTGTIRRCMELQWCLSCRCDTREILEAARIANVDSFVQHLIMWYTGLIVLTDDGGFVWWATSAYRHCACCLAQCNRFLSWRGDILYWLSYRKMVQEGMDVYGRTYGFRYCPPPTIVNSDVIMVMDHGRNIERGDHDSLMEQGGTYYRLYTRSWID